jgi:hypothetical protein
MITKKYTVFGTPIGRLYRIKGIYLPSVTSIISGFKTDRKNFTNDYLSIGTLGHFECLREYEPNMVVPDVSFTWDDDIINAKLNAINTMWDICKPLPATNIKVEFVVYDPVNRYAGQVDMLEGSRISDIKTGAFYKHYTLQLGAYFHAYNLGRKKKLTGTRLYILDSNNRADRNPDGLPEILNYSQAESEEFAAKFLEKAAAYNVLMDEYLSGRW